MNLLRGTKRSRVAAIVALDLLDSEEAVQVKTETNSNHTWIKGQEASNAIKVARTQLTN